MLPAAGIPTLAQRARKDGAPTYWRRCRASLDLTGKSARRHRG